MYLILNMVIGQPGAQFIITWDEGGKCAQKWMDIADIAHGWILLASIWKLKTLFYRRGKPHSKIII